MKYIVREFLRMFPQRQEQKRQTLRRRLRTMFQMDALEGQLDCLVRSVVR